jgi:hypothetical protein
MRAVIVHQHPNASFLTVSGKQGRGTSTHTINGNLNLRLFSLLLHLALGTHNRKAGSCLCLFSLFFYQADLTDSTVQRTATLRMNNRIPLGSTPRPPAPTRPSLSPPPPPPPPLFNRYNCPNKLYFLIFAISLIKRFIYFANLKEF